MEGQRVAAFGRPHPLRRFTGESNLVEAKARLIADHSARASLALKAVAHGDARRFALSCEMKLPAATGGVAGDHGAAPWLSNVAQCRLEFAATHIG